MLTIKGWSRPFAGARDNIGEANFGLMTAGGIAAIRPPGPHCGLRFEVVVLNRVGNIHSTDNSTNVAEIPVLEIAGLLGQVKPAIAGLPEPQRNAMAEPISLLENEICSGNADQSKVRSALKSMWTIAEGATGNLVAVGIDGLIGKMLGGGRLPTERLPLPKVTQNELTASQPDAAGRLATPFRPPIAGMPQPCVPCVPCWTLLAEGVVIESDGGGKVFAFIRPIEGRNRVLRLYEGMFRKLGPGWTEMVELIWIDGLPGCISFERGAILQTTALQIENGKILSIYMTRNPDKLTHVRQRLAEH